MKILNTSINHTLNGMCIVAYTKDFDRIAFYCSAVAYTKDGRARFYVRDADGKTVYRIVLEESDFRLIHALLWNGGSFKVESGDLVPLSEYDLKLIFDVSLNTIF